MSSFSGLNRAYTGLTAARAGMDVVGQNIANVNTAGYTRQRVETSALGPVPEAGMSSRPRPGYGVAVNDINRLNNQFLDSQVRQTAARAGYSTVRAESVRSIERITQEPGENGLSARLQDFWAAWEDMGNQTGEQAPAAVLLQTAGQLSDQLARGYRELSTEWDHRRTEVVVAVAEINSLATSVADLNTRIRVGTAAGTEVNELLDRRDQLIGRIAELAGGRVNPRGDGTVDVLVGGNPLVSGGLARSLAVAGATDMQQAATSPLRLLWTHSPDTPVAMEGGELAGALSVLRPADGNGTGGAIAEAARSFDDFARALADQVNAVHSTGVTPGGVPGSDFFRVRADVPAALGLVVVPTSVNDLAVAAPQAGPLDGSVADAIAQLRHAKGGPGDVWGSFITALATAARTETDHARLSGLAAGAAVGAQLAGASVDLDEENLNLLAYQRAYQAASRVMTAVDEALDTLINRTGIVGR